MNGYQGEENFIPTEATHCRLSAINIQNELPCRRRQFTVEVFDEFSRLKFVPMPLFALQAF